ncbi:4Fe-4S dicluster domain-containing protein [Reinekea marinisedimentorum]|uniref:4Fe-4S dicluster protein n=1 Tax=Reinekea marinisedimentorum TaxID=230495 RepID=A0A4V2UJH2_9GAMM|nr:4Fe-4S dicluster domain-containing protein [Reinekea marinisedimentorum]TCS40122.1 4Fe-4S dicluster protein [Reinekea marinisedimentorum]
MSRSGFLQYEKFNQLFSQLQSAGYGCVGPSVIDGAVQFGKISSVAQLPQGIELTVKPGSVRVAKGDHQRYFAWPNGAQGIKPWLYRSRELLWRAEQTEQGFVFNRPEVNAEPIAFIGARACDLAALQLQDLHFMYGDYPDPFYSAHRNALFIVGVNCSHTGNTCFCASTGDGPEIQSGFDLLLDELDDGFIVRFGSEKGLKIFEQLELTPVSAEGHVDAKAQIAEVIAAQERALLHENMHANIFSNLDDREWDSVAEKCLACGNCTMVCPTCFCHREVEVQALDGKSSQHIREWDSCFNQDHSYIHGITIRDETRLRYRQWMSHKLGSWRDQYDRTGCTGCGRCISWCPAAIDFVAEANLIAGDS